MIELRGPTGYGLEVWAFFKRYYLRCPQAFIWSVHLCCWKWGYDYGRNCFYSRIEISWPVVISLYLDWGKLDPELFHELNSEILPF